MTGWPSLPLFIVISKGNIPSNRQDLVEELRQAAAKGVIIVNTTQCCHGAVSAIYETGTALMEAGVIAGSDMTPEAALTKLSYVLSKDEWDLDTKRQVRHLFFIYFDNLAYLTNRLESLTDDGDEFAR